jgi:hypothetical protein
MRPKTEMSAKEPGTSKSAQMQKYMNIVNQNEMNST